MLRSELTNVAQVASALGEADDLLGFSIHALPIEEQAMFKTILLLPIGALVVCILRILVGLSTSGTFMPVLIALAFIETTLVTGLVGFLLVVSVGLMIRSYMSHLNLLLVARISAVIITVITIIAIFSVFSYRVGLTEGLKITFFPMIILSWTVERMSILWEEEGWREVAVQGSGSLVTAVAAYLAMTNPMDPPPEFQFYRPAVCRAGPYHVTRQLHWLPAARAAPIQRIYEQARLGDGNLREEVAGAGRGRHERPQYQPDCRA